MSLPYKNLLLLFAFCLLCLSAKAQNLHKPFVSANEVLPEWVTLMYANNPNVWQVDNARKAYYSHNPFQKTAHTQYYKRWRRAVAAHINAQGYVEMPTWEQQQAAELAYRQKRIALKNQNSAEKQLSSSAWECLGPFETFYPAQADGTQATKSDQANIYCIDQSLSNPNTLFCGTETGMIFKSIDKAMNWTSVSHNMALNAITAIEIHPTNSDIVYANDASKVIKTTDGGNTWTTILTNVEANDIAISPSNPQIVMVAAQQGFYRSTDGGANFTTLYTQSCYDIEFKPNDANVVYLVKNNPTAIRCEFFKSTNAGANFTIQTTGWFNGTDPNRYDGGARITVTPADPNRIYAILIGQAKDGDNGYIGVYSSTDAGSTWTLPNGPTGGPYTATHPCLTTFNPDGTNPYQQGFYNLAIGASHTNPNELYIGSLNFWRSSDGGATFEWLGGYGGTWGLHPDVQDIKIRGNDMWISTDGGVDYSNNATSITARNNGIYASDYWGFGSGWNNDVLVGGRYHNGNAVFYETYPSGKFVALGGGEAATGYVNPGENRRVYHSDIGGTVVGATFNGPLSWFGVGRFPNESYYPAESSEMEFNPLCYNQWYLGQENNLWRTVDGGNTFEFIESFGTDANSGVKQIEISRSNPAVMYVFQQPASGTIGTLWKTTDGGINWAQTNMPAGNSRICAISLSATDENTLWIGLTYGGNGAKIFKTTNGGTTWANLSTSALNDENIHAIMHQAGTNGGIYVGTQRAIYYRNNSLSNWQLYADGLPTVISTDVLKPFYKNSKIRTASYGKGIWQADLYEASTPIAQPMANKLISECLNDTIQFEDYSILDHNGATWAWQFEGGSPATSNLRNPLVAYNTPGSYDVTLTVTNANGSHTKTVSDMIFITPTTTAALPISENFESTPIALSLVNPDNEITWVATNPNCTTNNGNTAYFVNCFNYGNAGQTDDLVFPDNIDLNGVQGAWLKFRYAYAPYIDAGGTFTDSLRVSVSNNCGRTFENVFNEGGENLSTTNTGGGPNNNYESTDWYPESCADWQEACVNLSQYAGQVIQVKIQCTNGYGNNMFIDNIVLESNALLAPTINGNNIVCAQQIQSYTAPIGGSQYSWTITGGTIVGGQGTATVQVMWNNGTANGNLSVSVTP